MGKNKSAKPKIEVDAGVSSLTAEWQVAITRPPSFEPTPFFA